MPKPVQDAIAVDHIRRYLELNSDFAFEVKVLRTLRKLGLNCRHGGTYEDPITQKTRQFDIHAEAARTDRNEITRYRFAVECKNINFPLVVHRLPRDASEAYLDVVFAKQAKGAMLFDRSERITLTGEHCRYSVGEPVGKALDQVGRAASGEVFGSDQDVFDKMTQALNSSVPLLDEAHNAATDVQPFGLAVVVPVVVVPPGSLWAVDYDDDGNVLQGPAPQSTVSVFVGKEWLVGGKVGRSFWLSHTEIITFDALEEFISSWRDDLRLTAQAIVEFYQGARSK
jgi:hypothetical protein